MVTQNGFCLRLSLKSHPLWLALYVESVYNISYNEQFIYEIYFHRHPGTLQSQIKVQIQIHGQVQIKVQVSFKKNLDSIK